VKFEPVRVREKTPSGTVAGLDCVIAGGVLLISVTFAVTVLPAAVALTVAVAGLGSCAGAVKRPVELTVPAVVVQVAVCATLFKSI